MAYDAVVQASKSGYSVDRMGECMSQACFQHATLTSSRLVDVKVHIVKFPTLALHMAH